MVAAAIAAPAVAASSPGPAPNDSANYYWDVAAGTSFLTVDPASSELAFQISAQVSYRADPWVNPPDGASLQVIVVLDQPARLDRVDLGWGAVPGVGSSAVQFTLTLTPASFGGGLSAAFVGTAPGEVVVQGTMSVLNPGGATWAQEPAIDSGQLVQ